ncbi:MAG: adenine deaminase [Bacteroidia bacterium]|nr:adenine deaminase [Bacteroidia bacterium]
METSVKGHIVDVIGERIFDGTVYIKDGIISRITHSESLQAGKLPYIMPGFIDSHMHIESTLLLPENFAKLAVTHGTVAVVTDPHEITNVLGREGIEFMLANARKVKFHFNFGVPSCVPSTCFETAGAAITSEDVKELIGRDDFYGLAEMMNYPGVLFKDPEVMAKIKYTLEAGKVVDGHAPDLVGDKARQYIDAGISTDHEVYSYEYAQERVEMGMKIQIREGSAARNFETLKNLLNHNEFKGRMMICTDDIYPDELQQGHINLIAARAAAYGTPVWNILHAACVVPVKHYRMNVGLLQTGDSADFIVVKDLKQFEVLQTWIGGEPVFDNGRLDIYREGQTPASPDSDLPNKFCASHISAEDMKVEAAGDMMKVILATEGSLYTEVVEAQPKVENGLVVSDIDRDILKLVVYNRYTPAKPAVAFISGFRLKRGAIASTIAHDSHNIIALGANDDDIVKAVNTLVDSHGGLCIVDGEKMKTLALPVAGLMSPLEGPEVGNAHKELKAMAAAQGCSFAAPFMTLAFMALPVIPELKLTDLGLFDGMRFNFTKLFNN